MEHRSLGTTGIEVSRLFLGAGGFGGFGSDHDLIGRGESDDEAAAIMDRAWELGITTFDTADAYAGGASERAIGRWIASRGVRPTLATKVFHPMSPGGDEGLAPARIRRQLASSLERLGVDRVDLSLTHYRDAQTPLQDTLDTLDELRAEGLIGAAGGCHLDEETLRAAGGRYAWVQNAYSLLEQGDAAAVLPRVAADGLGSTPFSPRAGGGLADRYRRAAAPPPGSRMAERPGPYRGYERDGVWRGIERLRGRAAERGVPMATLAYAWVLSDPRVTAILIGPRRPEQVDAAVAALELRLSEDERTELASFFDGRNLSATGAGASGTPA
jgi:aryl-alcohol dehydrogenase-like predicted oxidoreductase